MAEIILNGQSVKTEAADMEDLKRQTYASEACQRIFRDIVYGLLKAFRRMRICL